MTKQHKYTFKVFTSDKEVIDGILTLLAPHLMSGNATFSTNQACGILVNTELTEPLTSQREINKLMKEHEKAVKDREAKEKKK